MSITHEFSAGHYLNVREEVDGAYRRHSRAPGADLSDLPVEVQEAARERWTPSVIEAAEAERNAPLIVLTEEEQAKADRLAVFPNLDPDQFWFGLRAAGYQDELLSWVASLNDPQSPAYDPMTWAWASSKLEKATFFERDHPLVEAAQAAIGISEAELDALWKFAAG
jgi:hypothetical protein